MEHMGDLQKVLVECASMGTSGNEPKPLAAEDREFLNNALTEFATATRPARHAFLDHFDVLEDLWTVENTEFNAAHFDTITQLESMTEPSDQANGFINLGGLDVCYNLLASTNEDLLISLCEILANVSQNNELFAKHPKCFPILKYLLVKLKLQTGLSNDVKAKLLYSANSITAGDTAVIEKIVLDEHVGLKDVMELLLKSDEPKVAIRLARLAGKFLAVNYDLPIVIEFTKSLMKAWIKELNEGKRLYYGLEMDELEFVHIKTDFVYKEIWCRGYALQDSGFSHVNIFDDIREFFRLFCRKFFPELCDTHEKEAWKKLFNLHKLFMAKVHSIEHPNDDEVD